jgi:UDP-2-acetamido-2-deoxy-ribo-hexuluronate aminotransferase
MPKNKINFIDLAAVYKLHQSEFDAAIASTLNGADFINGKAVSEFNLALAEFTRAQHVITCGNGTDALQIAMMALNLQVGDEIILPAFTYTATAEVIALLNLTPVFVDVCADTFNIDVAAMEAAITRKTRALLPVHLFGQCANMEAIMALAVRHNLFIIEDAAQAIGAQYTFASGEIVKAGCMGTMGCTSFFPTKNLGAFGDGGAIFCNEPELALQLKMIANHGQKEKYLHERIGVNSRLDTLQAAILNVQLKYLPENIARKQAIAARYDAGLSDITGLFIPFRDAKSTHVFHQYTLRINERRNELKKYLADAGIDSMVYYPTPIHLQKAYLSLEFPKGTFPIAEQLCEEVLSIPIHATLTDAEVDFVIEKIKEFFAGIAA